jgi:hypothetical protein
MAKIGAGPYGKGLNGWKRIALVNTDVVADSPSSNQQVEIHYRGLYVYASALRQNIVVNGKGFDADMKLTLDPPMVQGVDFALRVRSTKKFVLELLGTKWPSKTMFLFVTKIQLNGKSYFFDIESGTIAHVIGDPYVIPSQKIIYQTQTKFLTLNGLNLISSNYPTRVELQPTLQAWYTITGSGSDNLQLGLKEHSGWLPSSSPLHAGDSVPLIVKSINTGAGKVQLPDVVIAYVVQDPVDALCDDSCEFALDGVCDDGSSADDDDDGNYYSSGYYDDYYGSTFRRKLFSSSSSLSSSAERTGAGTGTGGSRKRHRKGSGSGTETGSGRMYPCLPGTDCTDCSRYQQPSTGGTPTPSLPPTPLSACTNTCNYARDGVCDDPRGTQYCALGMNKLQ